MFRAPTVPDRLRVLHAWPSSWQRSPALLRSASSVPCRKNRTRFCLKINRPYSWSVYFRNQKKLRYDYPSALKVKFDPMLIFLIPRSNFLGFRYMGEWKASVALR